MRAGASLTGSANSSDRLMSSMTPGDTRVIAAQSVDDADQSSKVPPAVAADSPQPGGRESSTRLMDAGEPGEARRRDTLVVARLSATSASMEDVLRSTGVGVMETKTQTFSETAAATAGQVGRARAKTGASHAGASSGSAAAKGVGKMKSPETLGASVPWQESPEYRSDGAVGVLDSKKAFKGGPKRPPRGASAAVTVGSAEMGVGGNMGVLESKAALKDGRRRPPSNTSAAAAASGPSSVGIEANQQLMIPEIVPESSVSEDDLKPGAVAIFPTPTSQSQVDVETSFYSEPGTSQSQLDADLSLGRGRGANNPYGEIMAEAHLVEEEDSDDNDDHNAEVAVEQGGVGQTVQGSKVSDEPLPGVTVATAKRVSPPVRFVQDHCILVSVVVLLVIGGIAGLSAYLATRSTTARCQGEDCGNTAIFVSTQSPTLSLAPSTSQVPSTVPTANPTFAPTTTLSLPPSMSQVPSTVPTHDPTSAPTLPCDMTPEDRAAAVSEAVADMVLIPRTLEYAASAQSLARKWLAEDDTLYPPLCPGQDGTRLQQRFGLALLHFAVGGESEIEGRGWAYRPSEDEFLSPINECDWAGVDCNSDTRKVTRIELPGRKMRGTLPAELFTVFEDLKVLNLQNNRVRGCIPDEIGTASSLEFLYLSANELACVLPSTLPKELEEIDLLDNGIGGPIPGGMLMGLEKLQMLSLGKNDLTGTVPTEIENLQALRTLHLDENKLISSLPMELYKLTNLVSLRLSENSFDSTLSSSIEKLSKLKELYLHDNLLSGSIPDSLFSLGEIQSVALSNNDFAGTLTERIGTARTLEVLRLDDTRLNGTLPASLSQLDKLEILSIQKTRIRGNVSADTCDLMIDVEGGNGNLRRLNADCDDEDCDGFGSYGVCCQCCDCTPGEYGAYRPSIPCYPYGEGEFASLPPPDEEGSLPPSRSALIIQKIIDYRVSDESALLQPSSPQGMAASWIIYDDELQLDSSDPSLLQRYAMAVLYFSTNGDNWQRDDAGAAFLSNVSACDWSGISCTSTCGWGGSPCIDGVINSIQLEYNSLSGTVPTKELSGLCLNSLNFRGNTGLSLDFDSDSVPLLLSDLYEFDFSESDLLGEVNEYLFYPSNVFLNGNLLNGTLPERYYGNQRLHLQYNLLSGPIPDGLGSAGSLRELRLDNNFLAGTIPGSLGQLGELEILRLENNELFGTVPGDLCDLTFDNGGILEDLWADCEQGVEDAELICSCCTKCFA